MVCVSNGFALSQRAQAWLRRQTRDSGLVAVARMLGLSTGAVTRAAAGQCCYRPTHLAVREAMRSI
jgi:hypothetical protein